MSKTVNETQTQHNCNDNHFIRRQSALFRSKKLISKNTFVVHAINDNDKHNTLDNKKNVHKMLRKYEEDQHD